MTTYANLTAEQKARLNEWDTLTRPLAGDSARLWNRIEAALDLWVVDVSAIMTELDDGEVVPNTVGLDQAGEMTDLDHVSLRAMFNAMSNDNDNANRQLCVKAAGAINTV